MPESAPAGLAAEPTLQKGPPSALARNFGHILSGLNGLGTAWIFVMMVLINADVIGRAVFNAPIRGVPLIISLSIIAIVFLQLHDALPICRASSLIVTQGCCSSIYWLTLSASAMMSRIARQIGRAHV